jgi:opacity protein-like surface antigen
MRRTAAVVALAALVAGTSTLQAQDRRGRDRGLVELEQRGLRGGFYITGGLGAGGEQFKFEDEAEWSEKLTKPTLTLRLGGTPDQYVRIGAELFGWGAETTEGDETFAAILGVVQFYPMKDGGLWLKAGGGYGESRIDHFDPDFFDITESGFAWSVGAGYEIQLSSSLAIGPAIELYQASFEQRDEPTLSERVLNIGGQITFQTGGRRR